MVGTSKTENSSVYLGDLAENVTEQLLYEVFAQAGNIQSVRLCRDSSSRKPLGYAYVNYVTPADATRALETLNHVEICGKSVRLMPSQRDPTARRSGVGNIFAKNLDTEKVTNKVLHDTFEKFGRVLSAKVATDASGKSKGYGFVQYEDPACADKAVEALNLTDLCGQQLFVGPFIPAKDRAVEPGKFCNVYVRNIGCDVDEETLRTVFGKFGGITSTVVMRNSNGKSRGFGFVNYENADHAACAVAEMDGYRHNNLKWRVNRAQKRSDEESNGQKQNRLVRSNLYLRNLDLSCSDEELRGLFEDFGVVENAKVLKDTSGNGKGVGFVQFAEPEDAEAAITGMNGKTMGNSPKPLFVTLAQRKQGPQPARSGELQDNFLGMQSAASLGMNPAMSGMLPPNMAFFPANTSFYYGPPMPVPPNAHQLVNPYFMSMSSGSIPVNGQNVMERGASLVSIPSGPYAGIGSAPSAPLPGMGSGMVSINSGPLPGVPGENSAPLPMYGGLMTDGYRRERRFRGRQGPSYSQQHMSNVPAMPAPQPLRTRPVLTSPFSAVQGVPPLFMPGHMDGKAVGMHARMSNRSISSASSMAPHQSSGIPNGTSGEEATSRRRNDQRRTLRERVGQRNSKWTDKITQMLTEALTQQQISQLLADDDAFALKVDACVLTLEKAEPVASSPCSVEDQTKEAESDVPCTQSVPVPAT